MRYSMTYTIFFLTHLNETGEAFVEIQNQRNACNKEWINKPMSIGWILSIAKKLFNIYYFLLRAVLLNKKKKLKT